LSTFICNAAPMKHLQRSSASIILFILVINTTPARAQTEKKWIKHEILALCSSSLEGRGYVKNGREKAAKQVAEKFQEIGLKSLNNDSNYYQPYSFSVNTFPDKADITINKTELVPGVDYLVDAASPSYYGDNVKIKKINLDKVKDSTAWEKTKLSFQQNNIYYLQHVDSFCKRLSIRSWQFAENLPKGCYIVPAHGKLTWTVATDTIAATVFYMEDTVLPRKLKRATVAVHALFLPNAKSDNIIGCIPGEVKDSFIVFTAHYDHLGKMGNRALFPGASDNASGTAMMLYLASYFAAHPQHYTMLFIAFSGEEAGLLGSKYFVEHPLVPLGHIRFLTNLDIMGDASEGVTVVNATEYPKEFSLLQQINDKEKCLPIIKSRGKAANSDHYFFSQAGVPAFFIYSNGGKGYYHDVFDTPKEITLNNIEGVSKLLIDFTTQLNK
jgi:aminopeptidase YwaD